MHKCRKRMARIVPTILSHFLRPDNCSCIVLPSDIPVGRLEVRWARAAFTLQVLALTLRVNRHSPN